MISKETCHSTEAAGVGEVRAVGRQPSVQEVKGTHCALQAGDPAESIQCGRIGRTP